MTRPRFAGQPVLPERVPLSRASRAEAEARIELAQRAGSDPALLEALVAVAGHVEMLHRTVRQQHQRILWAGTVQFDANGVWGWNGKQTSRAIEIYIAGTDDTPGGSVTVHAGPRLAAPPNYGPGVFTVMPGAQIRLNATNITGAWHLYNNGTTTPVAVTIYGDDRDR